MVFCLQSCYCIYPNDIFVTKDPMFLPSRVRSLQSLFISVKTSNSVYVKETKHHTFHYNDITYAAPPAKLRAFYFLYKGPPVSGRYHAKIFNIFSSCGSHLASHCVLKYSPQFRRCYRPFQCTLIGPALENAFLI